MSYNEDIVEKLSRFNNLSFTKKQWDIILKGCGCPKSCHFWTALRNKNLQKNQRIYTLIDLNTESFNLIWENYCTMNRESVKKVYLKKKVRKQMNEKWKESKGITFYMIGGALTTEIPRIE